MSPQDAPEPAPVLLECVRLRRELDIALARIAALEAQVKELLEQLRRNSSNIGATGVIRSGSCALIQASR